MRNRCLTLAALVLLGFSLGLAGCAQAEEPVEDLAAVAPTEPAKPQPGDMVLIPAGEFIMGSEDKIPNRPPLESPEHKVELPAYQIDVYEVTNGQWMKFTLESDYDVEGNWRQFYNIGKEEVPVTNVTWEDAKAYCEWAGKRLPTEAEWEKAARGTEGTKYPWGDNWDYTRTNCNEVGYRTPIEVGRMDRDLSPFGLYDTMGNAQEWTSEKLRPYKGSPARGDSLFRRGYIAVRGASYAMKGKSMSIFTRSGYLPKSQYGIGFRCANDAPDEEQQ